MKFNCGSTWIARLAEKKNAAIQDKRAIEVWHEWYAWFPVRVGKNDCRWLETVERMYMDVDVMPDYYFPMTLFVNGPTGYTAYWEDVEYRKLDEFRGQKPL